jgi:hypothetical protein
MISMGVWKDAKAKVEADAKAKHDAKIADLAEQDNWRGKAARMYKADREKADAARAYLAQNPLPAPPAPGAPPPYGSRPLYNGFGQLVGYTAPPVQHVIHYVAPAPVTVAPKPAVCVGCGDKNIPDATHCRSCGGAR